MTAKPKATGKTSRAKTKVTSDGDAEQKKALEALRESEAKFYAAFNSTPTALVITRLSNSQFEFVNESFLKLVGYERDEVLGKTPGELKIFPNPQEMAVIRKILLESKIVRNADTTIRSKNGELRHTLFSVDIIELNGQPSSLTTMVDITERIRAENQAVQMKRLYATLSQVNQTIVRVNDREELYRSICDVAVKFGEFALAWIGLLDDATGDVKPVAANGLDLQQWPFPAVNIQEGVLKNSLAATAVRTSKVITSEDILTDPGLQNTYERFQKYGYRSAAAIPFRLRGRTIGMLSLASNQVGLFQSREEVLLLDEMGLDISFALDTMETEAERQEANAKVERQNQRLKILREIDIAILAADSVENIVSAALSHIRELINCRRANLTLIDRETDELMIFEAKTVGATSIPAGSRLPIAQFGNILQTLSQNQPILLSDLRAVADPTPGIQRLLTDGLRSTCSLPLFAQGDLVGMFSMHSEIPYFFDEEKIALGREVANQVAIALTQNHLFEGLREGEEKYRAFFENSLDAILLTSPDGSIQAANPAACKMLGRTEAEICALNRSELVDTNDPRVAVLLEERARTGNAFGELTMLRNAGAPFPAEMSSALFQDGQGNTRTSMIIRDISERKRAEEEVRGKQQLFQKTFDVNPLASVLSKLPERTIVDANPAFEKLFG
jgi:PAS domain S-box-containing protein